MKKGRDFRKVMQDKNANYDYMADMIFLSKKAEKAFSHIPYTTIYPVQADKMKAAKSKAGDTRRITGD